MLHNYNDIQKGLTHCYCAKRRGCAFEAHFFVPFWGLVLAFVMPEWGARGDADFVLLPGIRGSAVREDAELSKVCAGCQLVLACGRLYNPGTGSGSFHRLMDVLSGRSNILPESTSARGGRNEAAPREGCLSTECGEVLGGRRGKVFGEIWKLS